MTPSEEWNRLTLLEKLRKLNVGEFQPGLYAEAADEIERLQAELNVVSSAPQTTMEGFFAMGDPEKTDLDDLIAQLREFAGRLGQDADEEGRLLIEETIAVLEGIEPDGDEEPPEEDGEST